jgi:hypothetical protein
MILKQNLKISTNKKYSELIISNYYSSKKKDSLQLIKANYNRPKQNLLVYGDDFPDLKKCISYAKIIYDDINIKLKKCALNNENLSYELLKFQHNAEGESQITYIQNYILESIYLKNIVKKYKIKKIKLEGDVSFIEIDALKNICDEQRIKLHITKNLNFKTILKKNIFINWTYLFLKFILNKFLIRSDKNLNFKNKIGICVFSNMSKHWNSPEYIYKSKFYLFFSLNEKFRLFRRKNTFNLYKNLSVFDFFRESIRAYKYICHQNNILNNMGYEFISKEFITNSSIYSYKHILSNLLSSISMCSFLEQNNIKKIRPWTSSLPSFSYLAECLSKSNVYKIRYINDHDFNIYFDFPYGNDHIKFLNNKYQTQHLVINNNHKNILKKKGVLSYFKIGSIKKYELDKFKKKITLAESCKRLNFEKLKNNKYLFFIPNSNLKGFYSFYEFFYFVNIFLMYNKTNNHNLKIIYKTRPGRSDEYIEYLKDILKTDLIVFPVNTDIKDIISISDVIVCKFSTIIDDAIILNKPVLRPILEKSFHFDFYDNLTKIFSNYDQFSNLISNLENTNYPAKKLQLRYPKFTRYEF